MSPQTVAQLYNELPEVIAIKEATGSLDMATEIASLCGITLLSGDDTLTLPLMSVGATGGISRVELSGNLCYHVASYEAMRYLDFPASCGVVLF